MSPSVPFAHFLASTLRSDTLCRSPQALVLPTPRSYVRADGAVAPDHWLDPSAVWEVKCADLSLSPIYPAARGLVSRRGAAGGTWGRPARWGLGRGSWSPRLCFPADDSREILNLHFIWVSDNKVKIPLFFLKKFPRFRK